MVFVHFDRKEHQFVINQSVKTFFGFSWLKAEIDKTVVILIILFLILLH